MLRTTSLGSAAGSDAADTVLLRALPRLVVRSKADASGHANAGTADPNPARDAAAQGTPQPDLAVSARTGDGLPALRAAILRQLDWRADASPVIARERHVAALEQAAMHLQVALGSVTTPELLAEELRLAGDALGSITGRVVADDLLG
ncbi:MAG: tRNA uridine-5-carboxymethylaminomethyl(34) synthesis GTPase MnmE, partial [Rhodospirillales bacterium]|nr:tRNA uridine-5-carboxymethylaminomethyl(34) synthesis GTPase MnmE [Rhodospirillales bacterium]